MFQLQQLRLNFIYERLFGHRLEYWNVWLSLLWILECLGLKFGILLRIYFSQLILEFDFEKIILVQLCFMICLILNQFQKLVDLRGEEAGLVVVWVDRKSIITSVRF